MSPRTEDCSTSPPVVHQASPKFTKTPPLIVLGSSATFFVTLLPTAQISIPRNQYSPKVCRALLDSGSQVSFITSRVASRLCVPITQSSLGISVLGGAAGVSCSGYVSVSITVPNESPVTAKLYVIPHITQPLPSHSIDITPWPHIHDLPLADPFFFQPADIDVLFGVDMLPTILRPNLIATSSQGLLAINTIFGWCILGNCSPQPSHPLPHAHE